MRYTYTLSYGPVAPAPVPVTLVPERVSETLSKPLDFGNAGRTVLYCIYKAVSFTGWLLGITVAFTKLYPPAGVVVEKKIAFLDRKYEAVKKALFEDADNTEIPVDKCDDLVRDTANNQVAKASHEQHAAKAERSMQRSVTYSVLMSKQIFADHPSQPLPAQLPLQSYAKRSSINFRWTQHKNLAGQFVVVGHLFNADSLATHRGINLHIKFLAQGYRPLGEKSVPIDQLLWPVGSTRIKYKFTAPDSTTTLDCSIHEAVVTPAIVAKTALIQ